MKFQTFTLALAAGICLWCAQPADADVLTVTVLDNDGSTCQVEVPELDRIEVGTETLTLRQYDGSQCTHQIADIDRITVSRTNGAASLATDGKIALWTEGSTLHAAGLVPGQALTVADMGGTALNAKADANGCLSLDITALAAGPLAVKTADRSAKIMKTTH